MIDGGNSWRKVEEPICMYEVLLIVHSTSQSIVSKSHSDEVRHKSSCPLITNGVGQHIALLKCWFGGKEIFSLQSFLDIIWLEQWSNPSAESDIELQPQCMWQLVSGALETGVTPGGTWGDFNCPTLALFFFCAAILGTSEHFDCCNQL